MDKWKFQPNKNVKTLRLTGILFSALLLGVLGTHKFSRPEPSYQGRTVHQWLYEELDNGKKERAIQHLGTNAISTLVAMVGFRESPKMKRVNEFLQSQSLSFLRPQTSGTENYLGKRGFDFLGTNAISAGPQLTRLALNTNLTVRITALSALVSIDPSRETLRRSINEILRDSTDPEVCRSAFRYLETLSDEAAVS
jgi:hypothetical protein